MSDRALLDRFDYNPNVDDVGKGAMLLIRDAAKTLATMIDAAPGDARCLALAITNLEQAVMWANKGISRA